MTQLRHAAILEPGYADYTAERSTLSAFDAALIVVPANQDPVPELVNNNVEAILVRERTVDQTIIDACPNLKLVLRYGVGIDNIDVGAASRRNIAVANVPDYGAEHEVSDHALGLYLAVSRRIVSRDREVRKGAWYVGQDRKITGNRDSVLGLIGFGRIARRTLAKFRPLGFNRVLVYDPGVNAEDADECGVVPVDLDTLCRESDVVSVHAPLNDATRHIIDRARLSLMKETAILINVARGGLVDEEALAEALRNGRIFGAGIDVFETEPPGLENPLFDCPNTVLSDHNAWYSEASVASLQHNAAAELKRVFAGENPKNWVNPC